MGDQQRIERVCRPARDKSDAQNKHIVAGNQNADETGGRAHARNAKDRFAPVDVIRNPANRHLKRHSANVNRGDKGGDLAQRKPRLSGINRPHRHLRGKDAAHQKHADTAQGRDFKQLFEGHRFGGFKGGCGRHRQQDRRERDRDQDRGDDEQNEPRGVTLGQDPLRNDNADHLNQHIGRQRLAAHFVGGGVVEPAFRGHIDAGKTEPQQDPQSGPDPWVRDHRKQNQRGRDKGTEGRKHPHMTDTANEQGGGTRSAQKAQEIA